jgi:two-component system CheB/CheR fusion protein
LARKKHPPRGNGDSSAAAQPAAEDIDSLAQESDAKGEPGFAVVAVGASAGGIEALKELLKALPASTGMAFVLVQHLDPIHASMLTEILSRSTRMPVREVENQMPVEQNHVYVIPPGTNMVVAEGLLKLSPRSEGRGPHRPIDHFMQSLAEDVRHRAIGVILSGSGTDGTVGLQGIKAEGGITFAQDSSAQHDNMPLSAVAFDPEGGFEAQGESGHPLAASASG